MNKTELGHPTVINIDCVNCEYLAKGRQSAPQNTNPAVMELFEIACQDLINELKHDKYILDTESTRTQSIEAILSSNAAAHVKEASIKMVESAPIDQRAPVYCNSGSMVKKEVN